VLTTIAAAAGANMAFISCPLFSTICKLFTEYG